VEPKPAIWEAAGNVAWGRASVPYSLWLVTRCRVYLYAGAVGSFQLTGCSATVVAFDSLQEYEGDMVAGYGYENQCSLDAGCWCVNPHFGRLDARFW